MRGGRGGGAEQKERGRGREEREAEGQAVRMCGRMRRGCEEGRMGHGAAYEEVEVHRGPRRDTTSHPRARRRHCLLRLPRFGRGNCGASSLLFVPLCLEEPRGDLRRSRQRRQLEDLRGREDVSLAELAQHGPLEVLERLGLVVHHRLKRPHRLLFPVSHPLPRGVHEVLERPGAL